MVDVAKLLKDVEPLKEVPRDYLGASAIGHPCDRYLWNTYNKVEGSPRSARTQRILDTGKALESLVVDWLRATGKVSIDTTPPMMFDAEFPFFGGNVDGVLTYRKARYVLEIKTAKASEYNKASKHGVFSWHQSYFNQAQAYMGLSGIPRCVFVVLNKDTSEVYSEVIEFNPMAFEALRARAKWVSEVKEKPKLPFTAAYYLCKMCRYYEGCHGQ